VKNPLVQGLKSFAAQGFLALYFKGFSNWRLYAACILLYNK
jgi:hypothetical protein